MKKNIGKILAVILVVALLATVLCACVPSKFTKAEANPLKRMAILPLLLETATL